MNVPNVPMPWGELFDKITILEIKLEKLQDQEALAHVAEEHRALCIISEARLADDPQIMQLSAQLKDINQKLWDIEDQIREEERAKRFGKTFIALARAVYLTNDERARLKREISLSLGSNLIEEKCYAAYL